MRIVTDSASDMPEEELTALNITQAPLYIQFPEGEVASGDLTSDAFYDRLEAMVPAIPTTSLPSGGEFAEIYRGVARDDTEILSVHVSSGLSGTINSARMGGQEVASEGINVATHDTMTLSGGQRYQVLAAVGAARAGWALPDIVSRLEQLRAQTEITYTLETLDYLARGGRIGRVTALAGGLLKLKPVIHVEHADGKYTNIGRARTISQALEVIASHMVELYAATPVWVTVLHGRLPAAAGTLSELLRSRLQVARLDELRVSPVLGVHTGPGVVGAAVAPMALLADLDL